MYAGAPSIAAMGPTSLTPPHSATTLVPGVYSTAAPPLPLPYDANGFMHTSSPHFGPTSVHGASSYAVHSPARALGAVSTVPVPRVRPEEDKLIETGDEEADLVRAKARAALLEVWLDGPALHCWFFASPVEWGRC